MNPGPFTEDELEAIFEELFDDSDEPKGKSLTDVIKRCCASAEKPVNAGHFKYKKNHLRNLLKEIASEGRDNDNVCMKVIAPDLLNKSNRGKRYAWALKIKPKILSDRKKSLIYNLIGQFSEFFLPPDEKESLKELLKPNIDSNTWLKKVEAKPRYPALYVNYPDNYEEIHNFILRCLATNKAFKASYISTEYFIFHPIKLIRRENISYISCKKYSQLNNCIVDFLEFKEYAIHRFQLPKIGSVFSAFTPPDSPIKNEIFEENVDGQWGILTSLVLIISGPPAQHLSEVRFHPEKEKTTKVEILKIDDFNRIEKIRVEIFDIFWDYTFKCWILGLGRHCQILSFSTKNKSVNPIKDISFEIKEMSNYIHKYI